jgi:hypothetical protein
MIPTAKISAHYSGKLAFAGARSYLHVRIPTLSFRQQTGRIDAKRLAWRDASKRKWNESFYSGVWYSSPIPRLGGTCHEE